MVDRTLPSSRLYPNFQVPLPLPLLHARTHQRFYIPWASAEYTAIGKLRRLIQTPTFSEPKAIGSLRRSDLIEEISLWPCPPYRDFACHYHKVFYSS